MKASSVIWLAGSFVLLWATHYDGVPPLHAGLLSALLCGLGATVTLVWWRGERPSATRTPPLNHFDLNLPAWFLLLVVYASSSAVNDAWFFPTAWRGDASFFANPFSFGMTRSLVAALFIAVAFPWLLRTARPLAVSAILLAGLAVLRLHEATGFDMIYRVDSPSFVYRYWCFAQTFPRPGFYDPHWNAGLPIPYLVASGIWSVGVFLLPLLHVISAEQLYTPALAVFFLGIVPALAWWSLAWVGAGRRARWIAVLLALGTCQRFWVHLLHYGTAPSLFAMSMALPLAALWYRFLYLDPVPRAATLLKILLFSLILFAWPGSTLIALPFLLITLLHIRRLFPVKWKWVLAGIALITVILLPLALVPMRYSNLAAFTQTTAHQTFMEHFKNGLGVLAHNVRGTNALIVVFGFLGSFFMRPAPARWFFGPLVLLLVVLSGWGEEVKKLLQSERIIIPAALVAILPAAWWLERLIRFALRQSPHHHLRGALLRTGTAWCIGILLLGAYQGAKTWRGDGLAPFHTMPPQTRELITWLRDHVPEQGRVMFAGRAVHGYGGAKIAALPYFTGREMMAADFYGFSPKLVEFQYPPRAFRYGGPDVLFEFMDLHNITHIVTWHDDWKKTYGSEPARYRPAHAIGRTAIFEVLRPSSLFLQGTGEVRADFDRFDVTWPGEPEPVVIKYNWADGLRASDGIRIYPHDAGHGVTFIGIDPGTNRHAILRYRR